MRNGDDDLRRTIASIAPKVGFQDARRYETTSRFLFEDVPLEGRRVLDVGAGAGALSVWAALQGASAVVALEPELDGGTKGASAALERAVAELDLADTIELRREPIERLLDRDPFDVAVLSGVINHLNEAAVVRLHRDARAFDDYVAIVRRLRTLLRPGAFVIVTDVGRKSIWNTIGRQGPWTHDIEWDKHQQPATWIEVFRAAGFELHDLRWSPLKGTGRLTGNRFVQYFTMAHFVLRFRAA
jgi:2-polyprenyl-3-methyl-5-hydroxy-6-metoxy-1,4-benzoquinol methylase